MVSAAPNNNQIVWIEDEESMESLARQRLRKEIKSGRYDFIFARSIREAREILTDRSPLPLILCDINLPDESGLSFLKELCEKSGSETTVIMVTAYGDMATIRQAMQSGAFDFVNKPLDFDDLQKTILRGLEFRDRQIGFQAERKALVRIEQEIDIARGIQADLIINEEQLENLGTFIDASAYFYPAQQLGSVYYDYHKLSDGRHLAIMANVSSSSLSGVIYMTKVHSILHSLLSSTKLDNAEWLARLFNEILCASNSTGHFVSCFIAIFSPSKGAVTYINAGHRPPLLLKNDGTVKALETTGDMALGLQGQAKFSERTLFLSPDNILLLYSHGSVEIKSPRLGVLGDEKLKRLLEKLWMEGKKNPQPLCDGLVKEMRDFAGDWKFNEDIGLLAIGYLCSQKS